MTSKRAAVDTSSSSSSNGKNPSNKKGGNGNLDGNKSGGKNSKKSTRNDDTAAPPTPGNNRVSTNGKEDGENSKPKSKSSGSIRTTPSPPPGAAATTNFNPISKWEEPLEIPSLTLFEIHRKPRVLNTDPNARVRMPLKVLNAEFHCPVCLGYIKKTSLVMECLHRFCGECIQKCLRLGKKECPSCRVHIPSRRSLRPDPNFDELIKGIYGDITKLEQNEEKEIETLNKTKNMNNAYSESRKLGIMQQAIHRKKKQQSKVKTGGSPGITLSGMKRKAPTSSSGLGPGGGSLGVDEPTTIVGLEESPLVDFLLRRHPQETLVDRLNREYLRTSGEISMYKLKGFLSQKLCYEPRSHFELLVNAGGRSVILDDCISLNEARMQICDSTEGMPMIIHYRIMPNY